MKRTRHTRPVRHTRQARRAAALLTALALPLAAARPALAVETTGGTEPMAAAEAFDGSTALPDAPTVAHGCGGEYGCSFRVHPGASREYTTAVMSLGNAAINCTGKDLDVYRTVTLESSTTDNLSGEISGSAAIEGSIDNTTDVAGSVGVANKTEITHTDHTAPTDKGPNADIANGATLAAGGTVGAAGQLKLSAKATFALAFKLAFSKEWKRTSTETTQVKFKLKAGDELQFGVLNAMTRTVGELSVDGTGKLIKNVTVDSPSSVNVSTLVAQTFTSPGRCLTLRPPGRALAEGLLESGPRTDGAVPDVRYRLTAEGSWAEVD
ncbi:hypothetical protein ACIRBX_04620 [Kitasatospora sp. NPDC096147]|uniref:hypothetical protein n=1 Tax=Kitasatospora sp. NPDC096147 TaxID=3364093 RepID=UPI0037FB886A